MFSLFVQFVDFAFGLFDEFLAVFFPLNFLVPAFGAFALAALLCDGGPHLLEYLGGFFFFAGFTQFGDPVFLLVDPFVKLFVVAAITVAAFVAVAMGDGAPVLIQFLAGALGEGFGLVDLALLAQGMNLFFALFEPRVEFAFLAVAFAVRAFAMGPVAVTGALTVSFMWFVPFAFARFVFV